MVHLNDVPCNDLRHSRMHIPAAAPEGLDSTELAFLGVTKPDNISSAIVNGTIDPMTHNSFNVSLVGGVVHVTTGPASVQDNVPNASMLQTHRMSDISGLPPKRHCASHAAVALHSDGVRTLSFAAHPVVGGEFAAHPVVVGEHCSRQC
jgi:hypothetical protein